MKTKITTLLIAFATIGTFALTSCEKTPGKVTFWVQNDLGGGGNITVNVTGQGSKTISYFQPGGVSQCTGNTGTADFSLAPGSYNYNAANTDSSLTWTGAINVTENGCLTVKLTN
jgi:hypothetical protein